MSFELWLPKNKAKAWFEVFSFFYSFTWITWVLLILVPFGLYENLQEWGYLAIGVGAALPCVVVPYFFENKQDARKPFWQKYWVKSQLWIAVFSFVGNYVWTHYFYQLLGAAYTFPAHRLNDVPITLYLMTHAYFVFYHAISNMVIRRVRHATKAYGGGVQNVTEAVAVFLLAYATAYGETVTIAHFPYYTFVDRQRMYSVGSLFYAIYFFVSFPMFFRMDEDTKVSTHYSAWRAVVDALAASMLVTLLLDFWRLAIGALDGDLINELPWLKGK
jgi:cycloeucalenol cycloisomerase